MKTFLLTATYLVGIGELILAIFFWVTHTKQEIRKVMALLALSTGSWAIFNGLTSYVNQTTLVDFFLDLIFVSGIWIVTSLLHLSIIFPYKTQNFDRLHGLLLYLPAIVFSFICLFSNTVVRGYTVNLSIPGYITPGELFILYEVIVSLFYISSVLVLFKKLRKLDGIHKKNTRIFLSGLLIGGLPAIILNLWFAFFGSTVNPLLAVVFSIFWVGSITYIIKK